MNLLSLVDPRLDNIYQIRRKWYYSSGSLFFQMNEAQTTVRLRAVVLQDQDRKLVAAQSAAGGKAVPAVQDLEVKEGEKRMGD